MVAAKQLKYWFGLWFGLCVGVSAAAPPSLQNPNVQQVTPHIFALVGAMDVPNARNHGFICNSVFIIGEDGVAVIDPGGSLQIGRMVLAQIRARTKKPITHVINTHHHADHWLGNQAFADLKPRPQIIGHKHMLAQAEGGAQAYVDSMLRLTAGASRGTRPVLPHIGVEGTEQFPIGGRTLVLYHPAHAHTEGDLAVYIPEEKTVIAGDILFYRRTPGWQDASPKGNEAALAHLAAWRPRHVVPGHGPVTDESGIAWMQKYIHILRAQVRHYADAGLTDYEMKDKIDVGPYRSMSGFATRFGTNVNRMFLEIEAEGF